MYRSFPTAVTRSGIFRFILDFVSNGNSASSTANLNVIETNPFKHLTHLSLKFLPGNDSDIKKYLARCLQKLKVRLSIFVFLHQESNNDLMGHLKSITFQGSKWDVERALPTDGMRLKLTASTNSRGSCNPNTRLGGTEERLECCHVRPRHSSPTGTDARERESIAGA